MARSHHVLELIPGENYLVLIDADASEVPGEAVVEELSSDALERRPQDTLSADLLPQVSGILEESLGALAFVVVQSRYKAARAWTKEYRARRAERAPVEITVEDARRVLEAVMAVDGVPPPASEPSVVRLAGGGVVLSYSANDQRVTVRVPDRDLAEVTVDEEDD